MMDFILNNWAELLIGLMAFVKVVIMINMIIADRIKPNNKK